MQLKWMLPIVILFYLPCAKLIAGDTGYVRCQAGEGYVYLYQSVDNFQVVANLRCGQKVEIVDPQNNSRVRVRTADGKEGYIPQSGLTASAIGSQQQDMAPAPSPSVSTPEPAPAPAPAASVRLPSAGYSPAAGPRSEERGYSRIEIFGGYSLMLPSSTALQSLNGFPVPIGGETPGTPSQCGFSPCTFLFDFSTPAINPKITKMNGFDSFITVNGNKWLGVDGGISYNRGSINATTNLTSTSCPSGQILVPFGVGCLPGTSPSFNLPITNLFFGGGPRFTYRHRGFEVFGHFLFGYDRTSSNNTASVNGGFTAPASNFFDQTAGNTSHFCVTGGLTQQQSPCQIGNGYEVNNTILSSVAFAAGGGADITLVKHMAVRVQFDVFPTHQNQQYQMNEKLSFGPVISFK